MITNAIHVKKDDIVVVISGNDRGKRGKVISVLPKKNRVIVEGVRIVKKALRKTQDRPQGGIQQREGAIEASKVMLAEKYDQGKGGKNKKEEAKS